MFIGYPQGKKGWRVYDLEIGNIFVSRDVIFSANTFTFSSIKGHEGAVEQLHDQYPQIYDSLFGLHDENLPSEPHVFAQPTAEEDWTFLDR